METVLAAHSINVKHWWHCADDASVSGTFRIQLKCDSRVISNRIYFGNENILKYNWIDF